MCGEDTTRASRTAAMSNLINFYTVLDRPEYFNPNQHALAHPFRAAIVGRSGAGKTLCLLNLIKACRCFSRVYVFAAMHEEPLYEYLSAALNDVAPGCCVVTNDVSLIPGDDELAKLPPGTQVLFVFDDVLTANKATQARILDIFLRGRKLGPQGCSAVFISQSWYAMDKTVRKQLTHLILTALGSKQDISSILRDCCPDMDADDLRRRFEEINSEGVTGVMTIDMTRSPQDGGRVRRNFDPSE